MSLLKTIFFFSWNQISCTGWSVWKKSKRNGCSSETVHIRPNVFEKLWFSLITKNVSTFFSCLHDFSIIQILREINFGDSRDSTHLEVLNFDLYEFFHFLKFTKSTKFRTPKMAKTAVFSLLNSPKLISRKIWMTENSEISTQFGHKKNLHIWSKILVEFKRQTLLQLYFVENWPQILREINFCKFGV